MLEISLDGQLEIGLSISSGGASDNQYARKPHSEEQAGQMEMTRDYLSCGRLQALRSHFRL